MITKNKTPIEIHNQGIKALAEKLGPVDMIEFLQQYSTGSGDYTRDRKNWLGDATVEEITSKIKQ